MLRAIYERGSAAQREQAFRNSVLSAHIRGERTAAVEDPVLAGGTQTAGKQRIVYTANNSTSLPGSAARSEGQPANGDAAVDEAYDGSGATYDFYFDVYDRNSINGSGLRLDSTVHYSVGYDNAFWNGRQMVYGDGDENLPEDQRLFNRFTISLDVIAHELTHGVTQYEANLLYSGQSGALNESMSDVFGSLVKQRTLNQTADQADWIIGAGLFTSNVNAVGLRSMKAPGTAYDDPILGKDPQPGHMRDYKNVAYDNGGVHINSGIPNRAFYVTATTIGGFAWEKAGRIWYVALRDRLGLTTNFQQAADITHEVAGTLYGADSAEQQAVRTGWAEVGIIVQAGAEQPGCGQVASLVWNAIMGRPTTAR
jgi:Zn-dependent metalloprotease